MDSTKRQMKLLELLEENKYLSYNDLSLLLNVTERTIRSDKKYLNSLVDQEVVKISKGRGLTLDGTISVEKVRDKLADCYTKWYQDDYLVLREFLLCMLFNIRISLTTLQERCFMNEKQFYKEWSTAKRVLNKNHVKVRETKNFKIEVVSTEMNIRLMIFKYLMKDYSEIIIVNVKNKSKRAYENFKKFIEQFIEEQVSYEITYEEIAILKKYFLISFIRKNLYNHKIEINEDADYEGISYECCEYEIQYFFYILSMNHKSECRTIKENSGIAEKIDLFFSLFKDRLQEVSNDMSLKEGLVMHLDLIMKQHDVGVISENSLLTRIKINYPLAYEYAFLLVGFLNDGKYLVINREEDIGYLAIHFAVAIERNKRYSYESKKIRIGIISQYGLSIILLMQEKILVQMGNRIQIKFIGNKEQYECEKKYLGIDYLISTYSDTINQDKVVNVNPVIAEEDMIKIERMISSGSNIMPIEYFDNLFSEKLFFQNLNLRTKDQVMEFALNKMIDLEYIDEKTAESILEREIKWSTALGRLVAIPHGIASDELPSIIGVFLLEKPIKWEKELVQLVLVIAINESDMVNWESVFSAIYEYFYRNFGIRNLMLDFDYSKFLSQLKQSTK